MINKITKIAIFISTLALASCGFKGMDAEEAIRYQADRMMQTVDTIYASRTSIPDGEITSVIVDYSADFSKKSKFNSMPSLKYSKHRDAMGRLKFIEDKKIVLNEFGGDFKVTAYEGVVRVVYTKIPHSVSCYGIPNVDCHYI